MTEWMKVYMNGYSINELLDRWMICFETNELNETTTAVLVVGLLIPWWCRWLRWILKSILCLFWFSADSGLRASGKEKRRKGGKDRLKREMEKRRKKKKKIEGNMLPLFRAPAPIMTRWQLVVGIPSFFFLSLFLFFSPAFRSKEFESLNTIIR